jgi:hypothetical protein
MGRQLVIYYENGVKQVVKPTSDFQGDWKGLVWHITRSSREIKNYNSYEVY